jgi:BASS family bile acid:Na+ symporter
MRVLGPIIANVTILWIIAVVVGLNRDRLSEVNAAVLIVLLVVNLLGYTAGHFGAKMLRIPESMRRALTLEVGMQNAGLGTVLAIGLFPERPATAIPTAAYTFGCMLTGTMLAQWWARKSIVEGEGEEIPVAAEE